MVLSTPNIGYVTDILNSNVTIESATKAIVQSLNTPKFGSMEVQLLGTADWTASTGTGTTKAPAVGDIQLFPLYTTYPGSATGRLSGDALARYSIVVTYLGKILKVKVELVVPNTRPGESSQGTAADSVGDIVINTSGNIVTTQNTSALVRMVRSPG